MLRDGTLGRYYEATEWIEFKNGKVRLVNIAVWTSEKSVSVNGNTITIAFTLTSWNDTDQIHIYSMYSGYDLAMTLIAVLQHALFLNLIEVDDIKKDIERSIEFLKDNIKEIDNLIRSIKIVTILLRNYIEKLKKEVKEDRELWDNLKVERIASEEKDSTMVSPASVYLSEGESYNIEGNVRLIEEIKKSGELVRVLRIQDSYNAQEYVYIYKYNNEYYAIKEYEFNNLQGYTHSEVILYKIKNPEIILKD